MLPWTVAQGHTFGGPESTHAAPLLEGRVHVHGHHPHDLRGVLALIRREGQGAPVEHPRARQGWGQWKDRPRQHHTTLRVGCRCQVNSGCLQLEVWAGVSGGGAFRGGGGSFEALFETPALGMAPVMGAPDEPAA